MNGIAVFSGSAHLEFAQELVANLGVELAGTNTTRFSNDCLQVQLLQPCRKRDVFIVQPIVPPVQENLVELLLLLDAARGASAASVTAVIPHFAYARSDKKDTPRISIGARLVADLLKTAGADRILTMALHAEQVHGFFSMPVDHLTALPALAGHFKGRDLSNTVAVSPDFGNAKQTGRFARMLGIDVAAGSKRRVADDRVVVDSIVGSVAGKDIIVLDDEIATAGSMVELINVARREGAKSVSVACTHALLTGRAIERLAECEGITEIVTTNTVPKVVGSEELPIQVCSVAPLFAEAVRRIYEGESIGDLFE